MSNINDYIRKSGDLDFTKLPFGEVDALVLSVFSYYALDNVLHLFPKSFSLQKRAVTIQKLFELTAGKLAESALFMHDHGQEMFDLLAHSVRFGNLKVFNYANIIDEDVEEQFSAVTFELEDGRYFVAYRGTDDTLIGWKENFMLAFSPEIPAQKSAKKYLQKVARRVHGEILVGGQSKGGNLAVYAAAAVNENTKSRICAIYNFDGPGFNEEAVKSAQFRSIVPITHNFVPESSVVGLLFAQNGEYQVVKSSQFGIFQHDPYSWKVKNNKFIFSKKLALGSQLFDEAFHRTVSTMNRRQRKELAYKLIDILNDSQANTVEELKDSWVDTTKALIKLAFSDISNKIIKDVNSPQ